MMTLLPRIIMPEGVKRAEYRFWQVGKLRPWDEGIVIGPNSTAVAGGNVDDQGFRQKNEIKCF
jgi:hypothetical protein